MLVCWRVSRCGAQMEFKSSWSLSHWPCTVFHCSSYRGKISGARMGSECHRDHEQLQNNTTQLALKNAALSLNVSVLKSVRLAIGRNLLPKYYGTILPNLGKIAVCAVIMPPIHIESTLSRSSLYKNNNLFGKIFNRGTTAFIVIENCRTSQNCIKSE